ncbi:MAG: sugar phosphate isomerase/epimerase [Chloroflexi bacterium]|nr:sugar phosphate isomerase/epimerase [Chloroflexota bacterium]
MDLGFALHPKWLGDGRLADFLSPLEKAGMTVLEFTLHPTWDEWPELKALATECTRAGYRCHFHAPYKDPYNADGFNGTRRTEIEQLYAPAIELIERLALDGGYVPSLVIHGAHAPGSGADVRARLRADTTAFLVWMLAQTSQARLMLENLPPKPGFTRTGESRAEVRAVVRDIDAARLNICWDFGHDVLLGYNSPPDDAFLSAVRHAHVHDIDAAGEDHFPLVYGNVPWADDLRALRRAGFDGAVVMEINGYRAQRVERLHERMAESFARMRAAWNGNAA